MQEEIKNAGQSGPIQGLMDSLKKDAEGFVNAVKDTVGLSEKQPSVPPKSTDAQQP
jgi:hypothetical protein